MLSEIWRLSSFEENKNKKCSRCSNSIGMIIHSILNNEKTEYIEICHYCYHKTELKIVYKTLNSTQIGLFDKKQKIGFIDYGIEQNRVGKIYDTYIRKNYRNKGFLRGILLYVINDLKKKGCQKIVLSSAPQTISIWNKLGFIKTKCPQNSNNFYNMKMDIKNYSYNKALYLPLALIEEGYNLSNNYDD